MPTKIDIGKFRSKITIRRWGSTQDDGGGSTAVMIYNYDLWAQVQNRSGSINRGNSQDQWQYDYKITFRLEKSRPVRSDYTIDYDNKRLKISSLEIVDEGKNSYYVARCTTIKELSLDTSFTNYEMQVLNYTATATGTDVTIPALIGKTVKLAFKDGIEFKVIRTGTPTGKQVKTTKSTGALSWSIPLEIGEETTIVYDNV